MFDSIKSKSGANRSLQCVTFRDLSAINFCCLDPGDAALVLEMRNHEDVRKWMFHSDPISEVEHHTFLNQLASRERDRYWMVREIENQRVLGVIYLNAIDRTQAVAEFGIYGNPFDRQAGKGLALSSMLLHIAFENLQLAKVRLQVFKENARAIRLYEKLGFVVSAEEASLLTMKLESAQFIDLYAGIAR